MSEPKLISPLLTNHIMGSPISDHNGVRCCPAILKDTDDKYIVKVISIPASSLQTEALLLSGAYSGHDEVLSYFKELSNATVQEAKLLQKLSKLEGFRAYPSWQVEPMEDGNGYDIYLLSEYGMTLERYLRRNTLTHLKAVNLGLDICAALAICRRNGYLYVDLKPENIYMTPNGEYQIGDLGFIHLSSLKYASLPDKYRNDYTAPEIQDAYSVLNSTLDVYALGLILYQAYNDGRLPESRDDPASPIYADYEMADIILKAIAPDPANRWEDPLQMGQALVSYMQQNPVNDISIIPIPEPELSEEVAEITEENPEDITETQQPQDADNAVESDEKVLVESENSPELPEENISEDIAKNTENNCESEEISDETTTEKSTEETKEASAEEPTDDDPEQFIIDGFEDDTTPTESDADELTDVVLSDEVNEMLAQADTLIAHKTPDPVVAPDPIDVPIPTPILPEQDEPETQNSDNESAEDPSTDTAKTDVPETEVLEENVIEASPHHTASHKPKKKNLRKLITTLIVVLAALLIAAGIFIYYNNIYIQQIDTIALTAVNDQLTVTVKTDVSFELLSINLTESSGTTITQPLNADHQAIFTSVPSSTTYKVSVQVSGFHKLTGNTTTTYTTAAKTEILSLNAITGDTDGSVKLNFSLQGPDSETWYIKYSAAGIDEQTVTCNSHLVTITGLEIGKDYTFRLVPKDNLYVIGSDTINYTVLPVTYPENLTAKGFSGNNLTVTWDAPTDVAINSWTVRCYNSDDFDTTFTVTDTTAVIEVPDTTSDYTIDVKAEGMSVSKWISISANSITFTQFNTTIVNGSLVLSWDTIGDMPEDGWMISYCVDGSEKYILQTKENSCTISPVISGGKYSVSFVLSEEITVFDGNREFTAPETHFDAYGVQAENFSFTMCPSPEKEDWLWYDIGKGSYTDTFTSGENAAVLIKVDQTYERADDNINTYFVIRNADGVPVSISAGPNCIWSKMWTRSNTGFDLPVTPTTPGTYTLEIYFGNQSIGTTTFTIVAKENAEET